jgi:two-component system invasion response regulator UvrY
MNFETVRIGLVENHLLFRQTLAHFLTQSGSFNVVLEAGHGKELQELMQKETGTQILLLDLAMPVMDGFETLEWLQRQHPHLPVIILTDRETDLTMKRLAQLGARCFLKKNTCTKELTKVVFRVLEDGYYFADTASRNLLLAMYKEDGKQSDIKPCLSEKEWRFLKLAATDMTYEQIAFELNVSTRCVDKTRNGLFEKMNVKNRAAMTLKAISNGIVQTAA